MSSPPNPQTPNPTAQTPEQIDMMYKLGVAEATSWAEEAGFIRKESGPAPKQSGKGKEKLPLPTKEKPQKAAGVVLEGR